MRNQPLIQTGYAPVNGTELYYETLGEGSPLILIHGGQLDRRMWDEQFRVFAQSHRVIRYDVRDHGLSKCPAGAYAHHEDLQGLLEHLQIGQATLMGLSLGALIAIDFALVHPDKVNALLLVSPGLSGYAAPSEQVLANHAQMIKAWEAGDMESVVEYFLRSWVDGPQRTQAQVDALVRERVRSMALERIIQGPSEGEPQPLTPPALDRLGEIHVPTLVVVGDLDMPDILAIAEILVGGIATAERTVMPGVAHMANMEHPAEFNQLVQDFLRKQRMIA
ncbi:MAG: alpha/beta fold hydrolase [Caldilineaceae bacterium]